jgi:hypothetical protein
MANDTAASPQRATEPMPCRDFRLSDAMILIAGLALSLSGAHLLVLMADAFRHLCRDAVVHRDALVAPWPAFWVAIRNELRSTLWYAFQVAGMVLLGMTPAFFVLRLRRPRPPLRALLRQPGTVAGMAMVLGLFWGTGSLITLFPDKFDSMNAAPSAIGGSVAAAWCALALSRGWEPEPGWIDWVGRVLGCAAIGTALLGLIVFRI